MAMQLVVGALGAGTGEDRDFLPLLSAFAAASI
jgi:hypothetical protein